MSEQFSDALLLKMWLSGEIASNQTLRETTSQAYADKARIVAMRAVLEGHLAAQPVAVTDNLGNTYVRDGNVWRSSDGQITVTLTGAASDGSPR
jgi:hypothetical protein